MSEGRARGLRLLRGDRPMWIIIVMLYVVSLLVVYSSTASMAYKSQGGDTAHYILEQVFTVGLAFVLTFVIHALDPKYYLRWSKYLLYLSILFMLMTYSPLFGVTLNGAARWIDIGVSFMPSEPLKIALVLFLAVKLGSRQSYIERVRILPPLTPRGWNRNPKRSREILRGLTMPLVLPTVVATACVFPSNLSTALIIAFLGFMMLHFGRVRHSELVRLASCAVVCVVIVITIMSLTGSGRSATWVGRIESFISPITGVAEQKDAEYVDNFQKMQAKIAIASGGVVGKGPGNSTQRTLLPHPYSDYAYAFIVEEYGLLGGVLVVVLYLWMFYRAGVIVRKSRSVTYKLVVIGLILIVMLSAFVNMGVSVGIFPVTGQSLPLISKGGTTLLFTSISLGIILGISRTTNSEEARLRRQELLAAEAVNTQEKSHPIISAQTLTQFSKGAISANEEFEFGVRDGATPTATESKGREVVSLDNTEL